MVDMIINDFWRISNDHQGFSKNLDMNINATAEPQGTEENDLECTTLK